MTITVAEAEDVLQTDFRAHWVAAGEDPARIDYQNIEFDIKPLPYFVRFNMQHQPVGNNELGGGDQLFVTRGGILQLEIYVRLGETKTKMNDLRETVLSWLEQFGVGFIRFQVPGLNDVGAAGGWWQSNGDAIFEYDTSRDVQ